MKTLLTTDVFDNEVIINEDKICSIVDLGDNTCLINLGNNSINVKESFDNLLKFYHEEA